jgi:hypothetical protein
MIQHYALNPGRLYNSILTMPYHQSDKALFFLMVTTKISDITPLVYKFGVLVAFSGSFSLGIYTFNNF